MNDYIYMLPITETFDNTSHISIANTNNNNTKNYFTTITGITSTKTVTTQNVISTNVSNNQKRSCYVTELHQHGSISSFCPTLFNVQKSVNDDDDDAGNVGCYATDNNDGDDDDGDDENGFKSVHQNNPVFYHSIQTWPTGNARSIPELNKFEGIYPAEWNIDNRLLTSDTYPSIQPDSITTHHHHNNNNNTSDYYFSPNTNYLNSCNSNSNITTTLTTTTTTNTITNNNSDNDSKTGNLNNTCPIPSVSHGYTYQQEINSSVYEEQPAYGYNNNNNDNILLGKCINKPDYPHPIISTPTLPSLTCHHPNHQQEQEHQQQQSSIIESNATEQQHQQAIQNNSTHFPYEICNNNNNNNRSIKDYSKSSTGIVYSNEDTNLHNQILPNPVNSTNCHISNLHESTRVKLSKYSGVNSSPSKCLYSLRAGLNSRKHRPSVHTMHGKSSELFRSNQQIYLSEYHRQAPKTNRLTHKLTYRTTATTTTATTTTAIANTTNTTVAFTSSNNIINSNFAYNLKSSQNHSTPLNNTTCQLIDSLNNNNNSILKQTTSQMNEPIKHSLNYEMCSKLKQNKTLISSANSNNGSILTRSPYKCRKCKGHGMSEPVRQHKRNCPFRDCTCDMCYLVEKGRRIVAQQIALFRDQKSHNSHHKYVTHSKDPRSSLSSSSSSSNKEIITMKGALDRITEDIGPHCRRCRNHGQSISWKGHKKTCPYRECYCNQCILISLRKSNEKDLREVAQEFTENRPDKRAMKSPLKATKVNSELNIHSADRKHQKNTNLLSAYRMFDKNTGSEGYNENIVSNSHDQIFPASSFSDRFHLPSVAKNCTNSWIHQLVTSSVVTSSSVSSSSSSLRPSYETNINQCENLSSFPTDYKPSYPSNIPTHSVLQETFTKPFQTTQNALNLVREYNDEGIVDSANFIHDEVTSQKLNPTNSMSANSSYNDLSMIQCRTSTITTSSTEGSKTLSDKLTDSNSSCLRRLPDYCSSQGYFNSGLPTTTTTTTSMTTSTINHICKSSVHCNVLFKPHDLVNSTDNNSMNYTSSEFSKDHVLYESLASKDEPEESTLHPLPNNNNNNNNITEAFPFEFHKSDRVSVFQNLIDSVKSNNDYDYYSNSSQFKPNYSSSSYPSNVIKGDTMNEFFYLNSNQEINSCHIVAPSLIKNTPSDYSQFTEVIQSNHPSDLLTSSSVHVNEEKLVGATAAAAAAHHVAALAAAVAYHHQQQQQQKHQHDYYQHQYQQPVDSRTQQEEQNNQPTTISSFLSTNEHMNALSGSLSVPLNFSNMYNNNNNYNYNNIVTSDNKGLNQTTESTIIKPPLLESIKTVYTQKPRQSSDEIYFPSLKKELNKFSREFFDGDYNHSFNNNSSFHHNYSPTYSTQHHQIREHQHDAYHPHHHQQQQQEEQSYSINDSLIINNNNSIHENNTSLENVSLKQLSTIKQKSQLYDYQPQSHHHLYNGVNKLDDLKSVQHQSSVQINQEINKLQIIHLTNAIILPPQQSVGQTQQEINVSINNNNHINRNNNTSWSPYYDSLVKIQQINQSNETDYHHQQRQQQQQQQSYKHETTSTDNFSSMSTTDMISNNIETLNSLPNEYCNNLFKKFEPSNSLFKQIRTGGGQRDNNNNNNTRID